jgi:hypothetical protein
MRFALIVAVASVAWGAFAPLREAHHHQKKRADGTFEACGSSQKVRSPRAPRPRAPLEP